MKERLGPTDKQFSGCVPTSPFPLFGKNSVLFESIAWPFDLVMEPEGEIAGGILHLPWLPLCTHRTEAHPPPRKTALEKDTF